MADGQYRFQQGAGQYFVPQKYSQFHQETDSLANNTRTPFKPQTPSPQHSPGTRSPAQNLYSMYGQTHQQGQNALINGHQRYGMAMNMPKQYQGPGHHPSHSNHHQQQDHSSHNGHNNFGNHQHNASASGFTSNSHFQPGNMRNGTPSSMQNGVGKPPSEHWAQQLQLAQMSREATGTHAHARNNQSVTKVLSSTVSEVTRRDGEREGRMRAPTTTEDSRQEWIALDCGGQGLRALSPQLFDYRFLDKLYLNNNKLSYLPGAIGLLRNLSYLDLSLNQLMDLPGEIGMLINLKTLLLFDNQIESLPAELGSLYQLDMLGIEGNPLSEDFKSIMMEEGTRETITYLREQAVGPEPPPDREWIVLDETESTLSAEKLRVLTYNTLCDRAATQAVYGYTPMNALAWDHRKEVILNELRARDADILCLQEIDIENYNEYFRPALAHKNFKGVHWPKSRARTMADHEAKMVDGCATFFKSNKFVLLDKQLVDFGNIAINRPDMKGEHDIFNRVMPKDNHAVVTFLENRASGERLIVVNAHLTWDPSFQDVKVVQTAILMEQIAKLSESWTKWPPCKDKKIYAFTDGDDVEKPPPESVPEPGPSLSYAKGEDIPLIVCGDFNSTPDSGVYDLISHGSLSHSHPDLGDHRYGNFTRDGITHPFKLKSSYSQINELSFTNYTPGFTGVIDYIWYSAKALQVTGLLGEVDKDYLQRVPGFPNYHFPSDHLALMAEFVMKGRQGRQLGDADFGRMQ